MFDSWLCSVDPGKRRCWSRWATKKQRRFSARLWFCFGDPRPRQRQWYSQGPLLVQLQKSIPFFFFFWQSRKKTSLDFGEGRSDLFAEKPIKKQSNKQTRALVSVEVALLHMRTSWAVLWWLGDTQRLLCWAEAVQPKNECQRILSLCCNYLQSRAHVFTEGGLVAVTVTPNLCLLLWRIAAQIVQILQGQQGIKGQMQKGKVVQINSSSQFLLPLKPNSHLHGFFSQQEKKISKFLTSVNTHYISHSSIYHEFCVCDLTAEKLEFNLVSFVF